MVFSNNLLAGAGGQATGYEIDQSIRFNDGDSPKLTGGTGQTGDGTQWTISMWVKRGAIDGNNHTIWSAGDGSNKRALSRFVSGGTGQASEDISFSVRTGGSWYELNVDVSFRDPSAWYHFVWVWDSDNGTSADRMRIYVNGDRLTSFSNTPSYPASATATDSWNNSTYAHQIGFENNTRFFDGYLAEMYHIDGQALTPDSFGETNSDTGQWVPKDASGLTFGTRGWYLKGEDSSDLGNDSSGNGNDFTSSGLAAADQMSDSPTDNFTTFNPIGSCNVSGQALTISDGNLRSSAGGTSNAIEAIGTIAPTTGKYYAEFTLNAAPQLSNQYPAIGIIGIDLNITGGNNLNSSTFFGYLPSGNKLSGGSSSSYGDTYGNGDIIGIALDLDNQKIYFSKNGTYQNSGDPAAGSNAAFTSLVAGTEYRFCVSHAGSSATDVTMNAGQSAFNTAAPTGFSPMSTANLPDPTIADGRDHMNTVLYTGNGATGQSITGVGFQPDWVWTKIRSPNAYSHQLFDAVRGAGKNLQSNNTNAEGDISNEFKSFDSDGFTIDDVNQNVNENGSSYVAWNWKANGSGSSNEDGSINTTATSANTTSGFSISTFTGNGTSGATFGHGLGVAPKMVIVKERSPAGNNWMVGHDAMGWGKYIALDTNAAQVTSSARWNDTAPSSTVVTLGDDTGINQNTATYVAYCFAEIEGYSAIGGYEGNGSTDGPFIYTGFKPAWIMLKRYDSSAEWEVSDRVRDPDNPVRLILQTNSNAVEWNATTRDIDWLSNGFKHRSAHADFNASSGSYLFAAFAETAFKHATAR